MALNKLTPEFLCSNLQRSLKFYVELIGFQVLYERPEHRFAYLDREGVQIMLEELGADREWIVGELTHPFGRGINFQFGVNDVTKLYNNVQAAGYPIYLAMEEKWYRRDKILLGNRQFLVQDPDGYLLRFAEDLGSKPVQD